LALSTGLQAALWALGGSPEEHRTDSLSAAFNNLEEQEELTRRYMDLCRHYGLRATRCNPGQSNENGSVEARHNSLKNALDQALRLRGTRSFETRADYEAFVNTIVQRMNVRSAKLLAAERAMLTAPASKAYSRVRRDPRASEQVCHLHSQRRALQRAKPAHWSPAHDSAVRPARGGLAGRAMCGELTKGKGCRGAARWPKH